MHDERAVIKQIARQDSIYVSDNENRNSTAGSHYKVKMPNIAGV